jgi:lysophospholipase L1-like esterase
MRFAKRTPIRSRFLNCCVFAVCLTAVLHSAGTAGAAEPLVHSNDRLTLIGGTLIESLQFRGDFEAALALAAPDLKLPVRNLGWSGDDASGVARRVFGDPTAGYQRLMADLEKAKPNVALIGYGWAEASEGPQAVAQFANTLKKLTDDLHGKSVRTIFLLPFTVPGVKVPGYDAQMEKARAIVTELAEATNSSVIDSGQNLTRTDFDEAGLRLSAQGQRKLGEQLAADLLDIPVTTITRRCNTAAFPKLAELAAQKDAWFFHHHRPMNETYLFLFRKHEQGNNAPEVDQFVPLVQKTEQQLWSMAAGQRQ